MNQLNVTQFSQLQEYAQGQIVQLPPFAEDQPFVARIRRPSMLAMMKSGRIPNGLLNSANSLFANNHQKKSDEDKEIYTQIFEVTELLAEASLLEPTLEQVKQAGLTLTDDQLMYLFSYTQRGVKALENFRQEQAVSENTEPVELVQTKTE